jgi:hypothetical protein
MNTEKNLLENEIQPSCLGAVIGSSVQEKYDELCKEITRLQEKYDENGYDYSPMIKLQRIEQHVDMAIDIYRKNCR